VEGLNLDKSKTFDIDINSNYVATDYIKKTAEKALIYIKNGFPVHLRGAAGVGKTSLAFYIATLIGRPVLFLCGSEEVDTKSLIGGFYGVRSSFLEDNYISSVYKKEEEIKKTWTDGKLLTACKNGYTVIYDEFTRAKPEINNVLLSILEEKVIDVPNNSTTNPYLKINPDFSMIFTSNPEEYVGVYKSPNALLDRMITIDMDTMDIATEKSIVMAKSGIKENDADKIISLTRYVRSQITGNQNASLRMSIMLAKVVNDAKIKIDSSNEMFRQVCKDIFNSFNISLGLTAEKKRSLNAWIDRSIDMICPSV
jgi:gas vesicle protein GvpN